MKDIVHPPAVALPTARTLSRRALLAATLSASCGAQSPSTQAPGLHRRRPIPEAHDAGEEGAAPRPGTQPATTPHQPSNDLLLLERFPALTVHLRRTPLGALPSPVELHESLGREVGVGSLWVKHDDRIAVPYGGGKIRKLELFLGEALRQGRSRVVTSGAVGSNHAVATAITAHQLGLDCTLLLMHGPRSDHTRRNLLANHHHGAKLRLVGGPPGVASAMRRFQTERDYIIPVGGTAPLGNLGYVNAALELAEQVRRGELPEPEAIYVALGTMGTAVGLAVGLALTPLATQVVAVRASNVPTSTDAKFAAELSATRQWMLERGARVPEVPSTRWRIDGSQLGRGYGFPTVSSHTAQTTAAKHGLRLETTYTAKAFAAMQRHPQRNRPRDVLFWHTYSALEPPIGESTSDDLPAELRGYFVPSK